VAGRRGCHRQARSAPNYGPGDAGKVARQTQCRRRLATCVSRAPAAPVPADVRVVSSALNAFDETFYILGSPIWSQRSAFRRPVDLLIARAVAVQTMAQAPSHLRGCRPFAFVTVREPCVIAARQACLSVGKASCERKSRSLGAGCWKTQGGLIGWLLYTSNRRGINRAAPFEGTHGGRASSA